MPKTCYIPHRFSDEAQDKIERANQLIGQYDQQGYTFSMRQLYYAFVSRDWIPNNAKSYANFDRLITDARRAGEIDWLALEDRGRGLKGLPSSWTDEKNILAWARDQYKIDRWHYQKYRVEVWVEKDALLGVLERPCTDLYVSYLSTRGFNSDAEMYLAARRFIDDCNDGIRPVILHLSDHDPSGIGMARDIQKRMAMFEADVTFHRIALTMAQVQQYNPPPNFAKPSDSRYAAYVDEFNTTDSWELDALDPPVIDALIRNQIQSYINTDAWLKAEEEEREGRLKLDLIPKNWDAIVEYLRLRTQTPHDVDDEVIQLGPAGDPGMTQKKDDNREA